MKKTLNFILHTALILALLAVAGLSLASILPIPGQVEIKIVQSGSMEPFIHTGSIVVIQPADSYAVGDVITFGEDTRVQVPTTHRIIRSREESGVTYFTTKGDANEDADAKETPRSEVIGRMLFTVPYVGYLIDFSKKPIGFISMVVVPATLIILYELIGVFEEVRKMIRKKKNDRDNASRNTVVLPSIDIPVPPPPVPPTDTKSAHPPILPTLLVALALPVVTLFSYAGLTTLSLFDVEQTTGNTLAAGILDLSLSTESGTSAELLPGEENGHTVVPVLTSSGDNLPFSYSVHAATEGDAAVCGALSVRTIAGPFAYMGPAASLSTGTTTDISPLNLLFFIPSGMIVPPSASCTVMLTYVATQEGALAGTEYHDDELLTLIFSTPAPPAPQLSAPVETEAVTPDAPATPPEAASEETGTSPAPEEPPAPPAPDPAPDAPANPVSDTPA